MSKEKRLEKALSEEKYRCHMVKSKKNWVIKGILFSTLLVSGLAIQTNVYADSWVANTPESIQIEDGATSYTLKEGDTLWAISQITNIKVETLAQINNIDLNSGEQYSLEVGRVIYFDGNRVTVKDINGNVVADKVLDDTDKVDASKTFNNQQSDTPKNSVQTDAEGNVKTPTNSSSSQKSNGNSDSKDNNGSKSDNNQQAPDKNGNGQGSGNNEPSENKPATPDKPTNPEKPEAKEYSVSVIHKDADGNVLEKEANIKIKDGETYTAKAKEFDNFTLVGQPSQTVKVDSDKVITFVYKKNETPNPAEKFDVTIKYVDENNKEIAKSDNLKVENGQNYTATAKTIEGYSLVGEATQSITVSKNETITFKYTKNTNPVEKFKITVKYEDEAGKEIFSSEIHEVEKGQVFTANSKDIADYSLIGESSQSIIVKGDETITFKYAKAVEPIEKYPVLVEYKDEAGTLLSTDTAVEVEKGKNFTATAKKINGYTLIGENTQTITVDKAETIIFKYRKNETPVTVDKTELQNLVNTVKNTEKGNYTDESFADFKTVLDKANSVLNDNDATQQQVNQAKSDLQSAFDNLTEKNPEVKEYTVTINYVDTEGHSLATDSPKVKEGDSYTATAKAFEGYELQGENTQTITVNTNESITFIYKKVSEAPEQVDTITLNAVLDGNVVKTVTKTIKKGEKFTPTIDALELDPKEYDLTFSVEYPELTGAGGKTYTYDFTVKKLTNYLPQSEYQVAKDTILREVNNYRASFGLEPVVYDEYLNRGADTRAVEIETRFDHVRPDGSGIEEAVMEQGAFPGIFGENIAINSRGYNKGEQAGLALFQQWKDSPDHRALMLTRQMKYLGVGIHSNGRNLYGVQLFSVMLYDNDTMEPLYPDTKVLDETEQTSTENSIRQNKSESISESTTEQSSKTTNETEQTTNESLESSSESSSEMYETSTQVLTVNKDELKEAYNLAISLDDNNYSVHSWSNLMFKIADAKQVFDNSDATQQQIDDTVLNLQQAINDLV